MIILQNGYIRPDATTVSSGGGDLLVLERGTYEPETNINTSMNPPMILHSGLWLDGGTSLASTTATDYYADGPLTSLTYEKWKPTGATGTWEYAHTGSASAGVFCIAAHTLGTSGSTFNVQYYNGAVWVDLCAATSPSYDEPIMVLFNSVSATRWRVNITAGTSAPEIGVVKIGTALRMPYGVYGGHSPISMARQTTLRSNYSETGEVLGRTKQRTFANTSFQFRNLTAAWVNTNWPGVQRGIEDEPFFIAWRPSQFGDVGLCQVDQVPVPQNMGIRDLMSVEVAIRAQGYD